MQTARMKISEKVYTCTGCGKVEKHSTNHYGSIFPFCSVCEDFPLWDCAEKLPESEKGKPYQVKAGEFKGKSEK